MKRGALQRSVRPTRALPRIFAGPPATGASVGRALEQERAVAVDLGEHRRQVVGAALQPAVADDAEDPRRRVRAGVERAAAVAVAARAQRLAAVGVDRAQHLRAHEALAVVAARLAPRRLALLVGQGPEVGAAQAQVGGDAGGRHALAEDRRQLGRRAAERHRRHALDRPVEGHDRDVVVDVARAVAVLPAGGERDAARRAGLAGGADAELVERLVADAVLGGHHAVGLDQRPAAVADVGVPRHRGRVLQRAADDGAGGGGEEQDGEESQDPGAHAESLTRSPGHGLAPAQVPQVRERRQQPPRLAQRERDRVVAQRRRRARPRAHLELGGRGLLAAGGAHAGRRRSRCRSATWTNTRRAPPGLRCFSPHCISECTAGHRSTPASVSSSSSRPGAYGRRSTRPPSTSEAMRAAEHRARHVEVALQVAEAPHAEEQVAQDQQRPALAHDLERARERAGLARVVGPQRHRAESTRVGSMTELKRDTVPRPCACAGPRPS